MTSINTQRQPSALATDHQPAIATSPIIRLSRELLAPPSPVPLYYRLAQAIRQLVNDQNPPPWQKLPSEQAVADYFHISRPTVRRAWQVLEQQRLICRDHGRGTFLYGPSPLAPDAHRAHRMPPPSPATQNGDHHAGRT